MANRFPLIVSTTSGNSVQELPSGDFLDLSQSGISNSGNITVSGIISGTGNITGGNITTSGVITATGNITGGNYLTAGLISATSTITSAANITGGNLLTAGLISSTGTITSASNISLIGNIVDVGEMWINTTANGNINLNPNGTGQVNIPTGILSVTGNIQGGNLRTAGLISATGNVTAAFFIGNGSALTGISSSSNNITNGTSNVVVASSGNVSVAVAGNNIVSFTAAGIINNLANGVGNIGNATGYFNTVFAKATSAQYADLAEMYQADADYQAGTVVEFGGINEVTISTQTHSTRVAGIVSTNPSYLMNATQSGEHVIAVALTGRVPCSVVGTIAKGDRLVASDQHGVATSLDKTKYEPGCIIGKALENYHSSDVGVIEIAVGRF